MTCGLPAEAQKQLRTGCLSGLQLRVAYLSATQHVWLQSVGQAERRFRGTPSMPPCPMQRVCSAYVAVCSLCDCGQPPLTPPPLSSSKNIKKERVLPDSAEENKEKDGAFSPQNLTHATMFVRSDLCSRLLNTVRRRNRFCASDDFHRISFCLGPSTEIRAGNTAHLSLLSCVTATVSQPVQISARLLHDTDLRRVLGQRHTFKYAALMQSPPMSQTQSRQVSTCVWKNLRGDTCSPEAFIRRGMNL